MTDRERMRQAAARLVACAYDERGFMNGPNGELWSKDIDGYVVGEAYRRVCPEELPARDATTWIQTYLGKQFFPLNPKVEDICIEDIARALSMQCRFTGHLKYFHSVAAHSVLASYNCPEDPRWALLHDASEAYLSDISRPVKPFLGGYREAELRLEKLVAERFGLKWPMPKCVKEIDLRLLATERRDLLATPPIPWTSTVGIEPLPDQIAAWSPASGEWRFLERFKELWPDWKDYMEPAALAAEVSSEDADA